MEVVPDVVTVFAHSVAEWQSRDHSGSSGFADL